MKKLIPALALLLVSAVMLATSSFAWFSMNTTVTVTGMEVKTRVSDNLFVAKTTIAATDPVAEGNFGSFINDMTPAETTLEPVSTIDGKAFFYTDSSTNVDGTGAPKANAFIAYAEGDAFDGNYGLNAENSSADAKGYVDYVMELKAVNGSDSTKDLKLTKLNLTYKGADDSAQKAFRVAVFMEKYDGSDYTMVDEATLTTADIFAYSGSAYFDGKAVNSTSTTATAPTLSTGITKTVARNATEFYKVVVRVWLEGQDMTCNNDTFVSLTNNWALDIAFELDTATNAATNIGRPAIAATSTGVTLTNGKLSNGNNGRVDI